MPSGIDAGSLKESPLWEHCTTIVQQLAQERPKDALNVFDSLSYTALTGKSIPDPVTSVYADQAPKPRKALHQDAFKQRDWAENMCLQLVPPKAKAKKAEGDEEPEEEEAEEDKGDLADVVAEQQIFNSMGEGITEVESFRLAVSMKRLLDKEPLAKARLWGRIQGTKRDYYIAETKIDEARVPEKEEREEEQPELVGKPLETIYQALNLYAARAPVAVQAEAAGTGANEFRYYVTTSDDPTQWTLLPDVTPAHIRAARLIHNCFSGDLEAAVDCHPGFPGLEKHYLRAQIARISATCLVAPKDIYTTEGAVEEEEEDEDGNKKPRRFEVRAYEEIPPLNPQEAPNAEDAEAIAPIKAWFFGYKGDELLEAKFWVHIAPTLLQEGRATRFKPEDAEVPEGEEEEDETAVPDTTELIHPFLSDLSTDKPVNFEGHSRASFHSWAFRKAYRNESARTRTYLARSLLWPGAVTYAVAEDDKPGAQVQSLYIGDGLKSLLGKSYAPKLPPRCMAEFPGSLKTMTDCTYDDELEFAPLPPAPDVKGEDEEENEDE